MNYSDFIHLLVINRELCRKDCCKNLLTMIINQTEKEYVKELKAKRDTQILPKESVK